MCSWGSDQDTSVQGALMETLVWGDGSEGRQVFGRGSNGDTNVQWGICCGHNCAMRAPTATQLFSGGSNGDTNVQGGC